MAHVSSDRDHAARPPDALWARETDLWTSASAWDARHPEAVMVFPAPVGVLGPDALAESLKDAPRWREATLTERSGSRFGDAAILTYRAVAHRDGEPAFHAWCSSVWIAHGDAWRIVHHQQSPA